MDLDSEYSKIAPENYRYASNMDGGYGTIVNGRRPHDGTIELPYAGLLEDSEYECIGIAENRERDSVIYFLCDNSGAEDHIILECIGSDILPLARGPYLNFSRNSFVHSITFIDDVMYWTDGWDYENSPRGNPPRHLLPTRHRSGKLIKYRMICNTDAFRIGVEYRYTLKDLDGNVTAGPTLFLTLPAGGTPYSNQMTAIFNSLDTAGFVVVPFDVNSASNTAKYIEFWWPVADTRVEISVTGGAGSPDVELHEVNFYPIPGDDFIEQLTIIKPTPQYPFDVQFEQSASYPSGSIGNISLKFRYRYHFADGEKSAWGPYTLVPTNFSGAVPHLADNDSAFNLIRLSFNSNDKYIQEGWRHLVKKVEIGVLNSSSNILSRAFIMNLDDYYLNQREYLYTGGRIYPAVASDENADPDVQALKNYDDVPKIALGLESVYDESGNTLLLLGGGAFDYDLSVKPILNVEIIETQLSDPLPSSQVSENKGLKRGGRYRVGLTYKDAWGRQSSITNYREVTIPWSKFVNPVANTYWTAMHLDTELVSSLPTWAVSYQICITENLNQLRYFQALTSRVLPIKFTISEVANFVLFGVSSGDYPYLGFCLTSEDNILTLTEELGTLTLFETDNDTNFQFIPAKGDRLHVQYWEGGPFLTPGSGNLPIPGNIDDYDYPIVGYLLYAPPGTPDQIEYYVLIDRNENTPRFESYSSDNLMYFHLEIYTPKTSPSEDVYYEFGEVKPITDGITIRNITHEWYGDTFIAGKENVTTPIKETGEADARYDEFDFPAIEWATLHKDDEIPINDLGRAVPYDFSYKEIYRRNYIKFSDTTQPDTEIRGASSFRGTNYFRVADKWGPVRKLVYNQNVLLAIMSTKTQPVYVAKDRLMDLSGASFVGRTDRIFNIADETMLDMGTHFPESVVYDQGKTFGFDLATGRVWRYTSGGGQVPISDYGVITQFQSIANLSAMDNLDGVHVIGGYRRSTETYYIRYSSLTLLFKNNDNMWISYNSLNPEQLVSSRLDTFVVKQGKLYLLSPGAIKAEYYGTQYETQIDFVFNDESDIMKIFDSMEIAADKNWYAYSIDVFPTPTYPSGMLSSIPNNKWRAYEGRRKAEFLRDQNDPAHEFVSISDPGEQTVTALLRGRALRGDMIRVRLRQAVPGENTELRAVYVNWVPSETIIKQ
jgi:hypothetical protein